MKKKRNTMFKQDKIFSSFAVNDLQQAKTFYGEILGQEIAEMEMGLLRLNLTDNNTIIIYPKPDHTPASFTILNFPVADIEKAVDLLMSKGITFEQYEGEIQTDDKGISRSGIGPAIAWFKDPAGNILSLLEETASE